MGRLYTPVARLTPFVALSMGTVLYVIALGIQPPGGWNLAPGTWRPISAISLPVWTSLFTGAAACVLGGWVWALRPRDLAAGLFAFSGVMTLGFCVAAVFWLLQTPLSPDFLFTASLVNMISASGFGIAMIALFLIYPVRLRAWRFWMIVTAGVFGLWTAMVALGPSPDHVEVHRITLSEMVLIVALAAVQIAAARHDPRTRAIAVWLGASVVVGAGAFIALVAAPSSFGRAPVMQAHYAFMFFLVIYAGLAVGLLRYRLFGLGAWAFQLIFTAGTALTILTLDVALIGLLSLEPTIALASALLLASLVYLPLRARLWTWVEGRRDTDETALFRAVVETAFSPSAGERSTRWQALLRDTFAPMEITASPPRDAPALLDEGMVLAIPSLAESPALLLRYRSKGRRLFSLRDLALAEQIVELMRHAEASRSAYERGVSEERARIARDIHDNLGAQLLKALHTPEGERKDAVLRETLAEMHEVINDAQGVEAPLANILADLRAETADRLEPHAIALDWQVRIEPGARLGRAGVHAVRAVIREAVSNTIKHAQAKRLALSLHLDADALTLIMSDDGRGFGGCGRGPAPGRGASGGNGLGNMRSRVEAQGGAMAVHSDDGGTRISARIPSERPSACEAEPLETTMSKAAI
ncbi:MAG: sensor histidine kinase [Brevundimonas sp.]|jgi:two-component system, NarL family, sensor histidine kinase DevS|uniref:sensor histidine kinase n=1 Tax=Brevundimonas sp. TaxID=1871086 RepID=UPI00391BD32D